VEQIKFFLFSHGQKMTLLLALAHVMIRDNRGLTRFEPSGLSSHEFANFWRNGQQPAGIIFSKANIDLKLVFLQVDTIGLFLERQIVVCYQ
jgi:hypothetical protein